MFRSFSRFRASSSALSAAVCFSRVYSYRNHRTSHPVPIPYIPVLHFATKPQHSLLRVEKMSNFALVVPSSIEEGDRL